MSSTRQEDGLGMKMFWAMLISLSMEGGPLSHFRAWQLFVQSVYAAHSSSAQNPVLLARQCPSYSHLINGQCCQGNTTTLGEGVSRDARGSYHLRTTTRPYLLPSAEAFHCPKETNLLPQFLLPSKE